ncbi:MAG: alpha-N-arabinofuranosidase, partial [Cyclobacteriaceae bacterium]|nr:alpha-N-arabinofuranosidase [Cyclobacteriaceae bacterium]
TDETRIVLTPTYHVFDLYQPHMDATLLPYHLENADYTFDGDVQSSVSASCSKSKDDTINITLVNIDPSNSIKLSCALDGMDAKKVTGRVISSKEITDHNTFDNPDKVIIKDFEDFKVSKGKIEVVLPSKSVVLLQVQ